MPDPIDLQVIDPGVRRIARVAQRHPEFSSEAVERAREIERRALSAATDGTVAPDAAEPLLLEWLRSLEEEFASLLSNNSRAFWLFLYRRYAPLRTKRQLSRTELICDEFATLAIMLYGRDSGTRFVAAPDQVPQDWLDSDAPAPLLAPPRLLSESVGAQIPRVIHAREIATLIEFDELVWSYWSATALLRRVWKGARLVLRDGRVRKAVEGPVIGRLIDLYDKRSGGGDLLSHVGLVASSAVRVETGRFPRVTWAVQRNMDRTKVPFGWITGASNVGTYEPNYVLARFGLDDFIAQTEPFREHIEATLGFDPWRLACFLSAMFWRSALRWREDFRLSLQQEMVGYGVLIAPSSFLEEIVPFYAAIAADLGLSGDAQRDVDRLATWLTYSPSNLGGIDLWSRAGRRLFLPVESGLLLDLGGVPNVLSEITAPIATLDKRAAAAKGALFEALVEAALKRTPRVSVMFRNTIVQNAAGRDVGEIDVGVLRDNVLLLFECKAHSVHESWERGTPEALSRRWEVESDHLRRADSLASAIASGETILPLPANVTHVAAIVVSSFASYVPSDDAMLFLNADTPRICTLQEAQTFVRTFRLNRYRQAPWMKPVARRRTLVTPSRASRRSRGARATGRPLGPLGVK